MITNLSKMSDDNFDVNDYRVEGNIKCITVEKQSSNHYYLEKQKYLTYTHAANWDNASETYVHDLYILPIPFRIW